MKTAYCKKCFSDNVHEQMWVNPNTRHIEGSVGTTGWCNNCNEETRLGVTELQPGDFVLVHEDGGPALGWYVIDEYNPQQSTEYKCVSWDAFRLCDGLLQTLDESEVTPGTKTDCPPALTPQNVDKLKRHLAEIQRQQRNKA